MPRWTSAASRAGAAVLGGYALASLVAVCCAVALPLAQAEAVLVGMLLGFVVYVAAVLWVFAARSAAQAWVGLALPAALLASTMLLVHGAKAGW